MGNLVGENFTGGLCYTENTPQSAYVQHKGMRCGFAPQCRRLQSDRDLLTLGQHRRQSH